MRTNLPPTESIFPFQAHNFFWNLSSTSFQLSFLILRKCIGIPRYLKVKVPIPHPKICEQMHCWFLASPKQNSSLLWKLILSPESCSKAQSKSFILTAWSRLLSMKMIVSSAYCKSSARAVPILLLTLLNHKPGMLNYIPSPIEFMNYDCCATVAFQAILIG